MPDRHDQNRFEVIYVDKFTDPEQFDRAQRNLQKLFGLKQRHLERLSCGLPVVIKKRIAREEAERYRDAVKKAGGVAWVQEVGPDGLHYERRDQDRRVVFDRRAFYRINVLIPDRRVSTGRRTTDRSSVTRMSSRR